MVHFDLLHLIHCFKVNLVIKGILGVFPLLNHNLGPPWLRSLYFAHINGVIAVNWHPNSVSMGHLLPVDSTSMQIAPF